MGTCLYIDQTQLAGAWCVWDHSNHYGSSSSSSNSQRDSTSTFTWKYLGIRDLSPLAYIAGVLEGKPSLNVYVGERVTPDRQLERADIALGNHSLTPIVLTARGSLALVNGTSVSAAVAALAVHEALSLAALS